MLRPPLQGIVSRNGMPNAQYKNQILHSHHDPQKEANRFLRAELSEQRPHLIIIFGEVLGYLAAAARQLCPSATIIALYPDEQLFHHRINTDQITHTAACNPHSLHEVFLSLISEEMIFHMKVLQWQPSLRCFTDVILLQQNTLKTVLEELHANMHTSSFFGARWIRNAFRNYVYVHTRLILTTRSPLTVITAAGPSLTQSIGLLKKYRPFIIATSSSLNTLYAYDLRPHLIMHTDGGNWAKRHLDSADQVITMPLTAALPSASDHRVLLFSQNSFPEQQIPECAYWIRIAEHATVAGSALFLAQAITEGPIIYAGLDLAPRKGRMHARPHTWDHMLRDSASFLAPEETLYHRRLPSSSHNGLTVLQQYQRWFASFSPTKKILSLTESELPLPRAREALLKDSPPFPTLSLREGLVPPLAERRQIVNTICTTWEQTTDHTEFFSLLYYVAPAMWKDTMRREREHRHITTQHREAVRSFLACLRKFLQ